MDRRAPGTLDCGLLALSPAHIWYSQEARPYSAMLFCLLLAIYARTRLDERANPRIWLWFYAGALFAGIFSHFYFAAYLVLLPVLSFLKRTPYRWTQVGISVVLGICLGVFIIAKMILTGLPFSLGYLRDLNLYEWWMLFFNWFATGNTLPPSPARVLVQLCFFTFFALGVWSVLGSARKWDMAELLLNLVCIPLALLVAAICGFHNMYIERSVFIVLPFFFMVVAAGAMSFGVRPVHVASLGVLGVLCITALVAHWTSGARITIYRPNEDWRSAAQFFGGELAKPPHRVIIFSLAPANVLNYYDSRLDEPEFRRAERESLQVITGQSWSSRVARQLKEQLVQNHVDETSGEIYYPVPLFFPGSELRRNSDEGTPADLIAKTVARRGIKTFYLLRDKYWWDNAFGEFQSQVDGDPRFELLGSRSWFALITYQYRIR